MILRICEPSSAWPGPDETALPLAFPLEPFLEVLASDPRKRPPILRELREHIRLIAIARGESDAALDSTHVPIADEVSQERAESFVYDLRNPHVATLRERWDERGDEDWPSLDGGWNLSEPRNSVARDCS